MRSINNIVAGGHSMQMATVPFYRIQQDDTVRLHIHQHTQFKTRNGVFLFPWLQVVQYNILHSNLQSKY